MTTSGPNTIWARRKAAYGQVLQACDGADKPGASGAWRRPSVSRQRFGERGRMIAPAALASAVEDALAPLGGTIDELLL
jgi:hypothetical protein